MVASTIAKNEFMLGRIQSHVIQTLIMNIMMCLIKMDIIYTG
jgi:hypothetical protein